MREFADAEFLRRHGVSPTVAGDGDVPMRPLHNAAPEAACAAAPPCAVPPPPFGTTASGAAPKGKRRAAREVEGREKVLREPTAALAAGCNLDRVPGSTCVYTFLLSLTSGEFNYVPKYSLRASTSVIGCRPPK